jgi:germination protein M
MTRRAAAILLILLGAAVVATVLLTSPRVAATGKRRGLSFLRVTPAPAAVPVEAGTPAVTPIQTVRVTVFFPGKEDEKLHTEERDIPKPAGASAYLKALFAELQRGPTREGLVAALPPKLQLRNAFLLNDGVAVLDLSLGSPSFGSTEEVTIVAALVDTVLQNVADTTRVRLLVNGEPAETLGGHVDLTRPLLYLRNEVAP